MGMDQDFEDVVMECMNCHLEFSAAALRADTVTNLMMCVNCLRQPGSKINILKDRPIKRQEVRPSPMPTLNVMKQPQKQTNAQIRPGFAHYRCTSCKYEFQRKAGFSNPCPYCSKKSITLVR